MLHTVNFNILNCASERCIVRSIRACFVVQLVRNFAINDRRRKRQCIFSWNCVSSLTQSEKYFSYECTVNIISSPFVSNVILSSSGLPSNFEPGSLAVDNHELKIYFVDINNNAVWSADFNGNNLLKHGLPYMSRSSFASGIAIYKVRKNNAFKHQ